jgi:hydrogenase-4 membrane subunit HyfE
MSAAQIHLALNHLPIAGVFFGVLFLAFSLLKKSSGAKLAGLTLFILSGLSILPVFLTGEGAEEIVEHKPGVTESLIHQHEEAAEIAFYLTLTASVLALIAFVVEKKSSQVKYSQRLTALVLAIGVVCGALLANAAHLGGMIRHDEIRTGTARDKDDD